MKRSLFHLLFLAIVPHHIGVGQENQNADAETVIQMAIDFPLFQEHLENNEIIEKDLRWYINMAIRDNGVIPTDLNLYARGEKIIFLKEKKRGTIGDDSFEFRFNRFKLKKNRASVEFEYYPMWIMSELGTRMTMHTLFILVDLELIKKNGSWKYASYRMEDVVFDMDFEYDVWIEERYKKLDVLSGVLDSK